MEMKITSSVSTFFKSISTIHFPSQCSQRAVDFTISFYYNIDLPFFVKILFTKPVRRRFSIIKIIVKNFSKLTESYIYRHLFFINVEGYRLKINSGAGAFQ